MPGASSRPAKFSGKAIGLCHGIFLARWFICQILGMPEPEVELLAAGLNHFQWVMHLREKVSGRDLSPLFKEKEAAHDPSFSPLTRKLYRTFGLWPTCSDDHTGEYLAPMAGKAASTASTSTATKRAATDSRT